MLRFVGGIPHILKVEEKDSLGKRNGALAIQVYTKELFAVTQALLSWYTAKWRLTSYR